MPKIDTKYLKDVKKRPEPGKRPGIITTSTQGKGLATGAGRPKIVTTHDLSNADIDKAGDQGEKNGKEKDA